MNPDTELDQDLGTAIDAFATRIDALAPGSGPPLTVPVTLSPARRPAR
ncbi:hypothetical protein [Asanoa siamensis]|uniref:Uncharacterized protein n=1 Tax=Asanoa siamensis TaxID=926357 RepID=A0ABQ4D208_9ACTN|nr:hypothetical protein [Asanoa siamensis]GIF77545.1 hypothetical protein Asi02nite_70630 [Asanoa siamensis]